MTVINDVNLGLDPSGYFQLGHIYYHLFRAQYNLVIEEEYQATGLRFFDLITAFVFLGAREDCEAGCPRPYVFKGCVTSYVHDSPHETRIITFRNLEEARQSMRPLEDVAKQYLESLEARRENERKRESED